MGDVVMPREKYVDGQWYYDVVRKNVGLSFATKLEYGSIYNAIYVSVTTPSGQNARRRWGPPFRSGDNMPGVNMCVFPDEQLQIQMQGVPTGFRLEVERAYIYGNSTAQGQVSNPDLLKEETFFRISRIDDVTFAITALCDRMENPTHGYSMYTALFSFYLEGSFQGKVYCELGGAIHQAKQIYAKENGVIVPVKKILR